MLLDSRVLSQYKEVSLLMQAAETKSSSFFSFAFAKVSSHQSEVQTRGAAADADARPAAYPMNAHHSVGADGVDCGYAVR